MGDFWLQSFFIAIYIRKEYNVIVPRTKAPKWRKESGIQ
jgi:hypothetical protein